MNTSEPTIKYITVVGIIGASPTRVTTCSDVVRLQTALPTCTAPLLLPNIPLIARTALTALLRRTAVIVVVLSWFLKTMNNTATVSFDNPIQGFVPTASW